MNSKLLLLLLLVAVLIVAEAKKSPKAHGRSSHHSRSSHHHKRKNALGLSDLMNGLNGILKPIIDYTKCIRYNEVQNIKSLLAKKGASWTAAHNDFSCMTNTQLRSYLGATKPMVTEASGSEVKVLSEAEVQSLPTGYIVNQTQPNCLGAIVNQGACGCCWAITAASVMADRVCMATNGRISGLSLSTQQITSCSQENGCNGGTGTTSWSFINTNGLTTSSCYPYSSASMNQGIAPSCAATSAQCSDNSGTIGSTSTYKIQPSSSQYLVVPYSTSRSAADTIALIKQEIYNNGPVQAWYQVPREYYNYQSGVYVCQNCTDLIGNHFSRIVGWGVSNNVGYWIIANSWDVYWGNRGFVWFAQGQLGIESFIYGGTPILNTAAPATTTRAPTPAPTTTRAPTPAPTTTRAPAPAPATTTKAPTPAPTTTRAPTPAPTTTVVPTSTSTPSSTVQQTITNIISNLNKALGVTFVSNSAMMSNCQRQANYFVNNLEPFGSGGWTSTNNNWPISRWTSIINGSPSPTKGGYELYGYNYDAMPTTFANSVSNGVISTSKSVPIATYLQIGIGIAQVPNSGQTYYVIDFAG